MNNWFPLDKPPEYYKPNPCYYTVCYEDLYFFYILLVEGIFPIPIEDINYKLFRNITVPLDKYFMNGEVVLEAGCNFLDVIRKAEVICHWIKFFEGDIRHILVNSTIFEFIWLTMPREGRSNMLFNADNKISQIETIKRYVTKIITCLFREPLNYWNKLCRDTQESLEYLIKNDDSNDELSNTILTRLKNLINPRDFSIKTSGSYFMPTTELVQTECKGLFDGISLTGFYFNKKYFDDYYKPEMIDRFSETRINELIPEKYNHIRNFFKFLNQPIEKISLNDINIDAYDNEETKSDDGFLDASGEDDRENEEETKSDDGDFFDTNESELGSQIIDLYRELSQLNYKLCEGYCKKRDSGWISYIKTKSHCKYKNCASVINFLIFLHNYLKKRKKNEVLTSLIKKMYNNNCIILLKKLSKIGDIGDNFENTKEFKEWLNTLTEDQKNQIYNDLQNLNKLLNEELDKSNHSDDKKSKRYVEIVKTQKHKDMWGITKALYAASAGRTRKKSKHHKRSRKYGRRNLRRKTQKA